MDLEIPEGLTGRRRKINWQSGVSFSRGRGQSHNDTIITMATGEEEEGEEQDHIILMSITEDYRGIITRHQIIERHRSVANSLVVSTAK